MRRHWAPRFGGETVGGRFLRRFRAVRRRTSDAADLEPGCLDVGGEGIAVVIAVIVVLLLLIFVGIPFLLALLDLVLLVVLTALGIAGRVLFRRPWTIEARHRDGTVHTWRVTGLRASAARRDEIAAALAAGVVPAPDSPAASA